MSGSCCGRSPPGGRHALLTPRDLLAAGRVLGRSCRLTWLLWKRGNASSDSFPKHWPSCASRIHRAAGSSGTSATFRHLQTGSKPQNERSMKEQSDLSRGLLLEPSVATHEVQGVYLRSTGRSSWQLFRGFPGSLLANPGRLMVFYYTHFDGVTFHRSVIKFEKASSHKGTTNKLWLVTLRTQFALGVWMGQWKQSIKFDRRVSKKSLLQTENGKESSLWDKQTIGRVLTNMRPASRMRPSVTRIAAVIQFNTRNIICQQNIIWQLY